jgi:hypothetical protein
MSRSNAPRDCPQNCAWRGAECPMCGCAAERNETTPEALWTILQRELDAETLCRIAKRAGLTLPPPDCMR